MAEEWTVDSDASDEEGASSLGSEGIGEAVKRKHVWTEPGDLELAQLYKRVAQDGYIELQCIERKLTKLQNNSGESEPPVSMDPNVRQQDMEEEQEVLTKPGGPVGQDSTFDFCEDVDAVPATPPTVQKRSALKGAKKRKSTPVGRWNNVIHHLQMDYAAGFEETQCSTESTRMVAEDKEKDVVHPCKEKAISEPCGGQSSVAGGFDMSFSLSSIDSSLTRDGLQDKIKHAEMLLASQQVD